MGRIIDISKLDNLHYIMHEKIIKLKKIIIDNSWTDQNFNLL